MIPRVFNVPGKEVKLHRSRKRFPCCGCEFNISIGTYYYAITLIGNSGVGGRLNPDRLHEECIDAFLEKEVTNG